LPEGQGKDLARSLERGKRKKREGGGGEEVILPGVGKEKEVEDGKKKSKGKKKKFPVFQRKGKGREGGPSPKGKGCEISAYAFGGKVEDFVDSREGEEEGLCAVSWHCFWEKRGRRQRSREKLFV